MSEFSVHRTADRIPALRYCLVLDGTRIAGGKPDYRGDNHLISWQTDETYGPVDDLMAENAKLRVFASCAYGIASEFMRLNGCPYYDNEMECSLSDECEEKDWAEQPDCLLDVLAKALGIEVDE